MFSTSHIFAGAAFLPSAPSVNALHVPVIIDRASKRSAVMVD